MWGLRTPEPGRDTHGQVGVRAAGPSFPGGGEAREQPLSSKCSTVEMAWHPLTRHDSLAQTGSRGHRLQGAPWGSQGVPRESQREHQGQAGPSPDLPTPRKGKVRKLVGGETLTSALWEPPSQTTWGAGGEGTGVPGSQ